MGMERGSMVAVRLLNSQSAHSASRGSYRACVYTRLRMQEIWMESVPGGDHALQPLFQDAIRKLGWELYAGCGG